MQKLLFLAVLLYVFHVTDAFEVTYGFSSNISITRHRRYTEHAGCTLPAFPEHGEWKLLKGEAKPGDTVPKSSVLKFECSLGYKLSQNPYVVCDNNWSAVKLPECEELCPPLYSTGTVFLKCRTRRGEEVNCHEATEGTYLFYNCTDFYETPFGYKRTLHCSDGTWSYPKPVCQPICGRIITNDAKPLIAGSEPNERLQYPWVTAIYRRDEDRHTNICGGSILSVTVVLTAAHCVTNPYGDVLPNKNYVVGAGKLYSKYKSREDTFAQYLEVSKIIVHEDYKGERRRFLGDIAVLVTKESFVLNDVIQPICFNNLNSIPLPAGIIGEVSGWGKTEDGHYSEILRTLKIPYKYETTCVQELPKEWSDKYNLIDKICAGFFNRSTSVCAGDSGSGLAFRNPDDNRYYVHGLVSLGPTTEEGDCNIQQNSLYTKVAFYYEFVDHLLTKYEFNDRDCVLPSFPHNGRWTIDKQDRKPGDPVPSNTVLRVKCNLGFKLSSMTTNIECGSAHNMPTCQMLCSPLKFPGGTKFHCKNKDGTISNCMDAVDGSALFYVCPPGYKVPDGTSNVRACIEGSWASPLPQCIREHQVITDSAVTSDTVTSSISVVTPGTVTSEDSSVKVICVYIASKYYDHNVDPNNLDSSLCTHMIYSSVGVAADGSLNLQNSIVPTGETKSLFSKVSDMKKRNPLLKVLLRVEGSSSGKAEYSKMAADPEKRNTFIRSVSSFMEIYNYDGVDVYWNVPQIDEKKIYSELLRELKKALKPKGWLLVGSVYIAPTYIGYDVHEMNKLLDWVNVHNYNNYLESSRYAGQYSAFRRSPNEGQWFMNYNLVDSADSWLTEGFAKDKMALSVAFYGRYFTLKETKQHDVYSPTVPGESGVLTYSDICQKYNNWTSVWDEHQQNPYRYSGNKWFGYDSPKSVEIKAQYIGTKGFFGVHVHSVDADDVHGKCGTKQILLKHIHAGILSPENSDV